VIAARWWLDAAAIAVIGVAGAHWLFRRARLSSGAGLLRPRTLSFVLLGAALAFATAAAGVLVAQTVSWFGSAGLSDAASMQSMLTETVWGQHWLDLGDAAVWVVLCAVVACVFPRTRAVTALLAAGLVAFATPLVGHAAAHGPPIVWMHRAHVAGAGLWIGTLAIALALLTRQPGATRLRVLRQFAPIAWTGATLLVGSGAYLAWDHIASFADLFGTAYGRVLSAKLLSALAVAWLGWRNWREPHWRRAVAEAAVAVIGVLLLTAWLSGLPMPAGRSPIGFASLLGRTQARVTEEAAIGQRAKEREQVMAFVR
jgi:putative copper export protein